MAFRYILPTVSPRHRHALALPIALVLALIPLSDFSSPLALPAAVSAVWNADDTEQIITVSGGRALLFPGGSMRQDDDGIIMERGSALIVGDDLLHVRSGEWVVTLLDGAVHVTQRDAVLTVAAVSTSAVAQRGDVRIVIPMGMQWRSVGAFTPLRDSIDTWMQEHAPLPLPEDFAFDQLRKTTIRSSLLGTSITDVPTADLVAGFSQYSTDVDTWLLTALHPRTAGLAWVSEAPQNVSMDDRLLRILAMPRADVYRDPFPHIAAERWLADVITIVPMLPEPDITLLHILTVVRTAANDAAVRGQPERVLRYRTLSERLLKHFAVLLTEDQINTLPAQKVEHGVAMQIAEPTEQPETRDPSAEMIAKVREVMLRIGALYTAHTRILDIAGDARITGIGFATPAGDRLFDLTVNLNTLTVRDIHREGEVFVNEVTLEQFAQWVRR